MPRATIRRAPASGSRAGRLGGAAAGPTMGRCSEQTRSASGHDLRLLRPAAAASTLRESGRRRGTARTMAAWTVRSHWRTRPAQQKGDVMRTLRLSLVGMLTLALLGGPSAMVVAQDDPMAPALVTGSITQTSKGPHGTESTDEYGAISHDGVRGPRGMGGERPAPQWHEHVHRELAAIPGWLPRSRPRPVSSRTTMADGSAPGRG